MTEYNRTLDTAIAEKVMGWEWWRSSATGRRCLFAPGSIPRFTDEWFLERADMTEPLVFDFGRCRIPEYSTDIAAAFTVVEFLRQQHYFFRIGNSTTQWIVEVSLGESRTCLSRDKSLPEPRKSATAFRRGMNFASLSGVNPCEKMIFTKEK